MAKINEREWREYQLGLELAEMGAIIASRNPNMPAEVIMGKVSELYRHGLAYAQEIGVEKAFPTSEFDTIDTEKKE